MLVLALSFLALILENLACKDFTCLATVSLHMHDEIIVPWQGFLFLIYIARQIYTLLKDLISISYFMFARAYFLESENYTKNANFFFYWSCKIVNCLIAISLYRYCALIWPIVILVNPLYFLFLWSDFVNIILVIVLNCDILPYISPYIVSMLSGW